MNKLFVLSILSLSIAACTSDDNKTQAAAENKTAEPTAAKAEAAPATEAAATFDKAAEIAKVKEITKAFGGALKGELGKAMKAGGPVNAIAVCNEKALPITRQVAEEQGAQISRVSLKLRNPSNEPNEWQTKILQDFDQRAANGEDIAKMGHVEIVEANGKKQIHFMKALPTAKVCLSCHGSTLAPEVTAKLNEMYPTDKATGYAENQVRGAVMIVKDIN